MSGYNNPSRATWAQTVTRLKRTFGAWGIPFEDYHIERDEDFGAVVTYRPPSSANVVRMELDSQISPAKNLSSIAITIESIRMQERRGLSGIASAHYLALSAPVTARDPFEVLGLRPDADVDAIEDMYKAKAKRAHPDTEGGSEDAMKELNEAHEAALAARGG